MNEGEHHTELNVHIDRLVVHGISLTSYQQARLNESVVSELTGLFTTKGIPKMREAAGLRGDPIRLDSTSDANQMGKQIAVCIYNSLSHIS